jgi:hypothetical protein
MFAGHGGGAGAVGDRVMSSLDWAYRGLAAAAAFVELRNGAVTAIATIVIAVFTVVLACVTRRQARLTRRAAEAAQKAASVAERALVEVERPWLFLEAAQVRTRPERLANQPPLENDWFLTLTFRNVGRMPAITKDCIFKIVEKDTIATTPDYSNASHLVCQRTVGVDKEFETNSVGPAPGRTGQLVFFGRLTYSELNGREHRTGFALEVAPHMPAFVAHGNEAYHYYD